MALIVPHAQLLSIKDLINAPLYLEPSLFRVQGRATSGRLLAIAVAWKHLVPFPFSDLSQSKVRPAVCLAAAGRGDWVLCQITSSAYGDPAAVFVGALLSLWVVAGLAVVGGRALLRVVPLEWVRRLAAVLFAALAVVTGLEAAGAF